MWEEIDIIERGGNYGWNVREGKHPFGRKRQRLARPELIDPIWEYHHDVGKSITGGSVYRGKQVPELAAATSTPISSPARFGRCGTTPRRKQVTANRTIIPKGLPVMSFGEDDAGEVYYVTQDGGIYKFASPKKTAVALRPTQLSLRLSARIWLARIGKNAGACSASRASSRAVQSHSPHAHGSVPFSSRQLARACAS